jgi:hypothetical protein
MQGNNAANGCSDFVTTFEALDDKGRRCGTLSSMKKNYKPVRSTRNRQPYSKPTVTKLTREQAKKVVVDRTGCDDQDAEDLLESMRQKPHTMSKPDRKAG